jgi:hypothetical protein
MKLLENMWCNGTLSLDQCHFLDQVTTIISYFSSSYSYRVFVYHYNNKGLFCDPNIIANNKERCFQNPAVANHNSSQTLKLLQYHNIRTRIIASPSQLPNLIQSQNFSDYNCFYPLFAINITSETICSKPITTTT